MGSLRSLLGGKKYDKYDRRNVYREIRDKIISGWARNEAIPKAFLDNFIPNCLWDYFLDESRRLSWLGIEGYFISRNNPWCWEVILYEGESRSPILRFGFMNLPVPTPTVLLRYVTFSANYADADSWECAWGELDTD
jgi:hypothetical protein